jgi:hypothetical protein
MVAFVAGCGSPSLMMIMCLTAASARPRKAVAAIFMPPSKAGMSPMFMRSMLASIILRLGPTRIMPPFDWPHSHVSLPFHSTTPQ